MILLLNATPDAGNQGMTALCLSALAGLVKREADPLAIADYGRGVRQTGLGLVSISRRSLQRAKCRGRSAAV